MEGILLKSTSIVKRTSLEGALTMEHPSSKLALVNIAVSKMEDTRALKLPVSVVSIINITVRIDVLAGGGAPDARRIPSRPHAQPRRLVQPANQVRPPRRCRPRSRRRVPRHRALRPHRDLT